MSLYARQCVCVCVCVGEREKERERDLTFGTCKNMSFNCETSGPSQANYKNKYTLINSKNKIK